MTMTSLPYMAQTGLTRFALIGILSASAVAAIPCARAAPGEITLNRVIKLASERSYPKRGNLFSAREAEARLHPAASARFPSLVSNASVQKDFSSGGAGSAGNQLTLRQDILTGGLITASAGSARELRASQLYTAKNEEISSRLTAIELYFNCLFIRDAIKLASAQVGNLEGALRYMEKAFRLRVVGRDEKLYFEVITTNARLRVQTLKLTLDENLNRLAYLTGLEPEELSALSEPLVVPKALIRFSAQELEGLLAKRHPAALAAEADLRRSRFDLDVELAEDRPKLFAEMSYSLGLVFKPILADSNPVSVVDARFGLSIPLFSGFSSKWKKQAYAERAGAIEIQRVQKTAEQRSRFVYKIRSLETRLEGISALEENLGKARLTLHETEKAFKYKVISARNWVDALNALTGAQQSLDEERARFLVDYHTLRELTVFLRPGNSSTSTQLDAADPGQD